MNHPDSEAENQTAYASYCIRTYCGGGVEVYRKSVDDGWRYLRVTTPSLAVASVALTADHCVELAGKLLDAWMKSEVTGI